MRQQYLVSRIRVAGCKDGFYRVNSNAQWPDIEHAPEHINLADPKCRQTISAFHIHEIVGEWPRDWLSEILPKIWAYTLSSHLASSC